jgi:hypothetical protein
MSVIDRDRIEWSPRDMLEITLNEPDDFLKVKETLTRIGISSKNSRKLYQSCHILHKQGRYFICHFKELFMLDGKTANFSREDLYRRNTIATLLADWGLCELVNGYPSTDERAPLRTIKIISHKAKVDWDLVPKYRIGNS